MIQWVIDAARRSAADEVLVATDDERIAVAAGALAVMTRADHQSGTDRIAEVAALRGWGGRTIVVNVQGDEPLLPPELIDQVASLLQDRGDADLATLCTPIVRRAELLDPNVAKVVCGYDGMALYFSRAPIPWDRDAAVRDQAGHGEVIGAHRHLGIYAYRVEALQRLSSMPAGELETIEMLEQLRALQAGMRIVVAAAACIPPSGVDTAEDLERVRRTLADT